MVLWKGVRHDDFWGDVPYYRFPLLAWLTREFNYRFVYRPKVHIAHFVRRFQ